MKHLKQIVISLALVLGFVALTTPQPAAAINLFPKACQGQTNDVCTSVDAGKDTASSMVQKIINTLLYILGAVAVIMIIIGAFRYVISGGSSAEVTAAKNTIMYAVVGLIVAILAYAIVNFVVTAIK